MNWYQKSTPETIAELEVDPIKGLNDDAVSERFVKYGNNSLESAKRVNPLRLLLSQFKDTLVIILIISATISLGLSFVENSNLIEPLLICWIF